MNEGIISFQTNHWKAAQADQLADQLTVQSDGLIAPLVNPENKKKSQLDIMKWLK